MLRGGGWLIRVHRQKETNSSRGSLEVVMGHVELLVADQPRLSALPSW
jgi:hypothetical protein